MACPISNSMLAAKPAGIRLLTVLVLLWPAMAWCGGVGVFDRDDTLSMRLDMPMSQYLADRNSGERRYFDAKLTLSLPEGTRVIPARLKMIGRMRVSMRRMSPTRRWRDTDNSISPPTAETDWGLSSIWWANTWSTRALRCCRR
jgi:hypothetical protein